MKIAILGVLLLAACGARQNGIPGDEASRHHINQLLTLHDQDRPKFVLQLQSLEQAKHCERATVLRETAAKMLAEANMQTGDTKSLTVLHLELSQAEKKCIAK